MQKENKRNEGLNTTFLEKKRSFYSEQTLRKLVLAATIMLFWLLIWALVFKLCNEDSMIANYRNLSAKTLKERIEWDLIPFNYRGEGMYKVKLIIATVLNCFVFAPFGVLFPLLFKKMNVLRDAAICFLTVTLIELLQLLTIIGNLATEDFITNMIGYFLGLGIYYLIFKRLSVRTNVIFFSIATVLCAIVTVYSIVTAVSSADVIYQILTRKI